MNMTGGLSGLGGSEFGGQSAASCRTGSQKTRAADEGEKVTGTIVRHSGSTDATWQQKFGGGCGGCGCGCMGTEM